MGTDVIFVHTGQRYEGITESKIYYLEGTTSGTTIYTSEGIYYSSFSLHSFEQALSANFCRIHECYLVALDKVVAFDQAQLAVPVAVLPISHSYLHQFRNSICVLEQEPSLFINGEGRLEQQ